MQMELALIIIGMIAIIRIPVRDLNNTFGHANN